MTIFEKLNKIYTELQQGGKYVLLNQPDATFYICIEQNLLSGLLSIWIDAGKPFPMQMRAAKNGLDHCVTVIIKDCNGKALPVIGLIKELYNAKIVIRVSN